MRKNIKIIGAVLGICVVAVATIQYLRTADIAVLRPAGDIAAQQRDLLVFATLLSMLVIVPVFVMTGVIAWKYRATNKKADYKPNWDSSVTAETVWWGIPIVIILILSVITWQSTHRLDPYRPIESNVTPLTVQAVALQWKWLFIYPDQNIASVNELRIPVDRPIALHITADAPMNSLWIPQLGGQIYAMSGMQTKLHLMANEPGTYRGSSANLSGSGFADMTFLTHATSQTDFDTWAAWTNSYTKPLDEATYATLRMPGTQTSVSYYSPIQDDLYATIMQSYMSHGHTNHSQSNTIKEHHVGAH